MKRLLVILACLSACLLAFLACNKEPKPVEPDTVPVQSVSISISSNEMNVDDMAKLTVTITPSNATNQGLSFSSSDPNVVEVDSQGNLWAHKAGTVTITVTTRDGGKTATITVTVKAPGPIAVTGVSLNRTSLELTAGDSFKLVATVEPSNASNKEVTWKSSAESVVSVDQEGNVKALGAGSATVSVTTKDGSKKANCQVTVLAAPVAVTGIIFMDHTGEHPTASLEEGTTRNLRVLILPEGADNQKFTAESSDPSVLEIVRVKYSTDTEYEFGLVLNKGIKPGVATVTVTSEEGGFTATCEVTVTPKPTVSVTGVTLNKNSLSLVEGQSETLTATVKPTDATNKNVSWDSSNTSVATVSSSGKVTAKAAGKATITVTTEDGGKTATCEVTVTKPTVSVTGVTLNKNSLSLVEGQSETLTATVSPNNATNKNISWGSSNTSVATVSSSGKVTAKAAGKATITVTTEDGGKTATCEVTVTKPTVSVTGITLNKTSTTIIEGGSETLIATVSPSNATNKNVTWMSKNTNIAMVTSTGGIVTARAEGRTWVVATTEDGGFQATCEIIVKAPTVSVTGVSLDLLSFSMDVGKTQQLTATVKPSNATNKNVTWRSSDTGVATVSSTGLVTAKSGGYCDVTVTTADGGYTASCHVVVTVPVTGVSLDASSIGMYDTQSYQLHATVSPSNATNKNVTWSSSNKNIVTVTDNGLVRGVTGAQGTAVVTVKTNSGGKTASCTFNIIRQIRVTGVSLDAPNPVKIRKGSALLISPVFTPSNASVKTGTWRSSNSNAISIEPIEEGGVSKVIVRGLNAGTYSQLTFTSDDGSHTAYTTVNVME